MILTESLERYNKTSFYLDEKSTRREEINQIE
jgi:hypothetical protein